MKRGCLTLILMLALFLASCSPALPASSRSSETAPTASFDAKDAGVPAPDDSEPTPSLSEEEMIAMWKAVIEEASKDDLTQEQALAKVNHASVLELMETCGAELLALELPEAAGSWQVKPVCESWLIAYDYLSRSIVDFESNSCHMLLELNYVRQIQICDTFVCFFIGGRGFGSQTDYYDVYYIPSDDIKSCLGYNSSLVFEERDDGWFAMADGDNTIFYQQLGEHLYFVAEHY